VGPGKQGSTQSDRAQSAAHAALQLARSSKSGHNEAAQPALLTEQIGNLSPSSRPTSRGARTTGSRVLVEAGALPPVPVHELAAVGGAEHLEQGRIV